MKNHVVPITLLNFELYDTPWKREIESGHEFKLWSRDAWHFCTIVPHNKVAILISQDLTIQGFACSPHCLISYFTHTPRAKTLMESYFEFSHEIKVAKYLNLFSLLSHQNNKRKLLSINFWAINNLVYFHEDGTILKISFEI